MSLVDIARRRQLPAPDEAKRIRKLARITSGEMAKEIGVHPVTLSRYEAGNLRPTGRRAERWACALADLRDVIAESTGGS